MRGFLTGLLALSAGGGAAIALVLLIRRLTGHRYAAKWRCLIWLLLGLRLAVPLVWTPPRPAPVQLPEVSNRVVFTYVSGSPAAPTPPPQVTARPSVPVIDQTPPKRPAVTLSLFQVLFFVWLAGVAAVLAAQMIRHLRFCRWVRRWGEEVDRPDYLGLAQAAGVKRPPRLVACPGLNAPMLAGLLRPRVLLPQGERATESALCHEFYHHRRGDLWRKALLLWVAALHWFNPLVWAMVRCAAGDMELACDDLVARSLAGAEKKEYAQAILAASERRNS